jgi:hypothetical protein
LNQLFKLYDLFQTISGYFWNMNYHQRFILLLLVSCFTFYNAIATTLTGSVIDGFSNPLPYSSVYVKGSSKGTTANADGRFSLDLAPGKYIIFCTHVGYQSDEKEVEISDKTVDIFFRLYPIKAEMKDVVVKANAEDPAYAIIRQAIKTRPEHLNEVKAWQVDVYMKGIIRTVAIPKSIFGIEFKPDGDVIDSSGKGIIYLSESLTKYSRRLPDDYKEDIVSAKVSGRSQGFGFNSPNQMELNLYENNITVSGMSSRGFVSPIANNALGFYNYKYEGTFYQNGVEINRIRIIPKRLYEPLFSGYINIIENNWRIHSADLLLTKTAQLEIVDSLRLQQQMFPVGQQFWMPQQTTFFASFGALGIKANANFAAVYSDYNLDPVFDKKTFGKVIRTADTSANKRSLEYWETIRPVPLTEEEYTDYRRKDTIEQKYSDPRYLDSVDKERNRITPLRTILSGITITRRSTKMSYSLDPLVEAISYNTVEGLVINIAPRISHYSDTGSFTIVPTLRYGFSNKRPQASLSISKVFGQDYFERVTVNVSGGRNMYQINPYNPIPVFPNTVGSLVFEQNFLKLYEKTFATISTTKRLADGLRGTFVLSYEKRHLPENSTDYKWRDVKDRRFTDNYPEELSDGLFPDHKALLTGLTLRLHPGQKYIEYPNRRFSVGSNWPVFLLYYTHGWKNALGSDVDFDKWRFTMTDEISLKLAGRFHYRFTMAGFFNNRKVYLPDYHHFLGNRSVLAGPYLQTFQLAEYYLNSNAENFFVSANLEHHFNGALTNKIPFVRKLNLGLVTGVNTFVVNNDRNYFEAFAGIENILKLIRADVVFGYKEKSTKPQVGIRLGFSGIFTGNNIE